VNRHAIDALKQQIPLTVYLHAHDWHPAWPVDGITALTYVLTFEDPGRFKKSRDVGSFLGLRPR
jgi:transposase